MENPLGKAICKQLTFAHTQARSAARLQETVNLQHFRAVYSHLCSREAANINIDCAVQSKTHYICHRSVPAESANTEYGASARAQWQDCERGLLVSLKSLP